MKRSLSFAVTLLCLLFLPSVCSAQFQNHFNLYTTQSLDSDTVTIHQTVTLDGYTVVPPGMPPNVVHTPHVQNKIGSTGGWFTGPGACPSCHITYSPSISHQQIGNLIEEDDTGGEVQCTIAGTFFIIPPIIFDIHIGITNFTFSEADALNCYYAQSCPNGNSYASCPAPGGLVVTGGQLDDPPCSYYAYAATYHLVVNLQCFPVGVTSLHNYPVNCQ